MRDLVGIDRLTSLDSAFVRLEAHNAHMHVGWVSRVELPPARGEPVVTVLRRQIARRLHLVPRFRQRLVLAPGGIAEPAWVDDPSFSIDRHVGAHAGGRLPAHVAGRLPGVDESALGEDESPAR